MMGFQDVENFFRLFATFSHQLQKEPEKFSFCGKKTPGAEQKPVSGG
jgi:hypothetical protein